MKKEEKERESYRKMRVTEKEKEIVKRERKKEVDRKK